MELTLILGPMKSGKTYDLISYFSPLKYTTIPHVLYQSLRNVRDQNISSRNGVGIESKKVLSLQAALESSYAIIGIDEVHMFVEEDAEAVNQLLKRGTKIIASGLDMDHQGRMFGIVRRLLELGPKEVRYKKAVCECCQQPNATHTQVLNGATPLTDSMPSVVPDDGTYIYKPVCRNCFIKSSPVQTGIIFEKQQISQVV